MNPLSKHRLSLFLLLGLGFQCVAPLPAAEYEPKPDDPYFAKFNPRRAPAPGPCLLEPGDRLAIVGDSITEQKMYSRILETYLTACVPELKITVRQFGWSGETAAGFRNRMRQDCLRFQPTVATLCYGMNDARYRPYDDVNGEWYRENYTAIVRDFKAAGARVVLGSPGCSGKLASWVRSRSGTLDEHNLNLCTLRDIAIGIAERENVRFADLFWPMFVAARVGAERYGQPPEPAFEVCGQDGIHPGWAGHLLMAHGFLRALGLDGQVGTITLDLATGRASASAGHAVTRCTDGTITLTSTRYPFCATGPTNRDSSIRAGMMLVPFNAQLNQFRLVLTHATADRYTVTWGSETRTYAAAQLTTGINLADDFPTNPFLAPFQKVDEAVAAKQAYETAQIKKAFHSAEARADFEGVVQRTEAERAPLAAALAAAVVPVTHTLQVAPVP